jgi:Mce-associated membrane protein
MEVLAEERRTARAKAKRVQVRRALAARAAVRKAQPASVDEQPVAVDEASVAERKTTPRDRGRLATWSLLVLLAAALVAGVLGGQRWYAHRQLDQAHQAALAAARQATVDFVSVSASTVDRDLQRIQAGATGEFADEFTRGTAQVRAAVVDNKVESQGTVLRAGLVSGDLDSAVVLVAVDATVKNVRAPDGRPSHYRIQVDLAKDAHSGRWLVSRLQFVG